MATFYPKLNEFVKNANATDVAKFPARDTTSLFQSLKRIFSLNAKVFGHYSVRKSALASFDFLITAKDKSTQDKAEEAKIRLTDAILSILEVQLKAVAFGSMFAKLKVVATPEGNKTTVEKVFAPDEYDYDFPSVYLYKEDKNGDRKKGNGYDTIDMNITNDYIFDVVEYPHRGGLLRTIMPLEILRMDMLIENANFLRKLKGLLQIVNKGGTPEDEAAAENAAANLIKENFFISSDSLELKFNQVTAAQSYLSFRDFNEYIDNSIAIAWLGNANTSELPAYAGSRAALQVQKMMSADIFYSDMNRVENLINRLLLIDFRLNWESTMTIDNLPHKFLFNLSEEQDLEANASAIDVIVKAGIPLIKSEVYKRIGFTPPQSTDELLEAKPTNNFSL